MRDGLSLVYSFFDPDMAANSLGSYIILDQIARAQKMGLPHVYLGYLIEDCSKMNYKKRFKPLQILDEEGWQSYTEKK
jgi:arginine-tRNA-protein transferase